MNIKLCITFLITGLGFQQTFCNDFTRAAKSILKEVNSYAFLNAGSIPGPDRYLTSTDGYSNGAPVTVWEWSDSISQKWTVNWIADNEFSVKAYSTNVYLRGDAGGNEWSNGDLVELYSWQNWGSQKWNILYEGEDNTRFHLRSANRYLNASGYNNGDAADIWQSDTNDLFSSQEWQMRLQENVAGPSITKASSGNLVAYLSHKTITGSSKGIIYSSADTGQSWNAVQTLDWHIYGPSLFTYNTNLYMLYGSDGQNLILMKSTNNGTNWISHVLKHFDALESGGGAPVLITDDYLYYGFMDSDSSTTNSWPAHYRLVVASCPTASDLTQSSNWTFTEPKEFPSSPAVFGTRNGWLEPNCVPGPDGEIWILARVDDTDTGDTAAVLKLSSNRQSLEFTNQYPADGLDTGFIDAPWAGSSKFHIVYDDISKRYLAVSNPYMGDPSGNERHPYARNVLALYETIDLKNYQLVKTLIEDDLYENWAHSTWQTGFQQPSFIIDNTNLCILSRTAYQSFDNYHDANMISYHELNNFRDYLTPDGEIAYYSFDDTADIGADSSKMANSSADVSGATWNSNGRVNGCAAFDGSSSLELKQRVSPKLHRAACVTISMWYKNDYGNTGYLYSSPIDGLNSGTDLIVTPNDIRIAGRSCRSDSYQSVTFPYSDSGQWHHLVAQWNFSDNALKLWIDNIAQTGTGSVSFSNPYYQRGTPQVQDRIGCKFNETVCFSGSIDEVHIFRRTLSESERSRLFTGEQSGFFFGLYAIRNKSGE
jgi:hypothetical protein